MSLKYNMVGWFEIPVSDMDRAIDFYKNVFQVEMDQQKMGDVSMAFFPWDEELPGAPGALVHYPDEYQSSQSGVLIYFSSLSGDLNDELTRVENAGGKVILPKKLIAEDIGYMALFLDSEGNKMALHSKA